MKTENLMKGLNARQVEESRKQHGANVLSETERESMWKLYIDKYRDPIIQILLVAAAISLALACINGEYIETIGIILAVLFATTVGFYFERDAAKKFNVLTAMGEEQPVKVRREGRVVEVPRKDVVVGDLVLIDTGDEVPADGKLMEAVSLEVNESMLTGEPSTMKTCDSHENAEAQQPEGAYPADMLLRSSMVLGGRGLMQVTAVGDGTEIGHVARQSTEKNQVNTPLNEQLEKLGKLISKVGTTLSVMAFVVFLARDIITDPTLWHSGDYVGMASVVLKYFMMAVTLIVMAVPEGLPMAITLSLALNMRRMLRSNNLVRKLHACETMGAVTVICTDKTGTLTQNKMKVVEFMNTQDSSLHQAIAVNSSAELDGDKGIGNPTEVALLLWLKEQGQDYRELRRQAHITHQVPFSTERKYMLTEADGHTYIKGAPEVVMGMCQMTDNERKTANKKLLEWQQKGMRTLAFAESPTQQPSAMQLKLSALTAIADPVRPDVPNAVKQCQQAGIEVKVVTGDTAATALEIARQIGIHAECTAMQHITGVEFAALSDEEALQVVSSLKVMSRARPTDKQRLVQLLQQRGEVVAVTGDGTNDAPALNHAHVGLSLGSGTAVAKEASDMTLLDDSFASIAHAVMWGRSLYKNLQRFLYFQLVVNVTALLLVLAGSAIGTELPLTVTQILWVNLIMDTFAAMALASLPPSREVMKARPRKKTDFIISRSIAWEIGVTGTLFATAMFGLLWYCLHQDPGIQLHELSIFFTAFVMLQFWNLFNAKSLGSTHSAFRRIWADRGLLLVLLMVFLGQWLITELGGDMFRTNPLSFVEWVVIIAATSSVLWLGEIKRWIERHRQK